MKFYHSISLNKNICPSDFYAGIVRLKPENDSSLFFKLEAQPGDEINAELVENVLALCKERGLDKVRGAYSYLLMPLYETVDLEAALLLQLQIQKKMFKGLNSDQRDERGYVVMKATEAKPTVKIASIWPKPWIVVSDAVRQMLEAGGLVGLKFDGVSIEGHSIHAAPAPFWELRSSVTLPKMINSLPDTSVNFDHVRYLIHGSYGEPHYRESEIQLLGSFDIAHTFERLSGGEPGLVVSQRFYKYCLKNKIPLEVRPARIDPD